MSLELTSKALRIADWTFRILLALAFLCGEARKRTLVRHYFAPGSISAAASRVSKTAVSARLIPPGGIPSALGTGKTSTSFGMEGRPIER